MMKMLFWIRTRRLPGVHIVSEGATEPIRIGQATLNLKGTIDYFIDHMFNYPTFAEAYKIAELAVSPRPRGGRMMQRCSLSVALAATLIWAMPAAAQPTGAPASTMTAGSAAPDTSPPHRRPPAHRLRERTAARRLGITPRPPLNIDCGPAQERAARGDLAQAQYRLKCGQ